MKKGLKNVFVSFLFICLFFIFNVSKVNAKSVSSDVFEIVVGKESLSFNYSLVSAQAILKNNSEVGYLEGTIISMRSGDSYTISEGKLLGENGVESGVIASNTITMKNGEVYTVATSSVYEKIVIPVTLKGLETEGKSYRWEHNFCYKIVGMDEICELDKTGKDQGEDSQAILSNQTYNFSFWDGHMPYYSEELMFEYIRFSNKFICIEENSDKVIVLDDIEFKSSDSEIDYSYAFSLILDSYEKDGEQYVGYDKQGLFVNNGSSSLSINNVPTYKIVNEICVSETECDVKEYNMVTAGYYRYSLTPYIGNINLPYNSEQYKKEEYKTISYKTTLTCLTNCENNRRVKESIVLLEKTFNYYINDPYLDEKNTEINSYSEPVYVKSSEVKITMKEDFSGINENSLGYYLARNDYNSCEYAPFSSDNYYSFVNGEKFTIGEGLNGSYCMYYVASSNVGTTYVSDYYNFYFDNTGPLLNSDNYYDKEQYYNEIYFDIELSDYSSIGKVYYLWTNSELPDEEGKYLTVKNSGKISNIENNLGRISSLGELSDGAYYLYILVYDALDNYRLYEAGPFNVDTTALTVSDIIVVSLNMDSYSDNSSVAVTIDEMEDKEVFKCGFFNQNDVTVSMLDIDCKNNESVVLPSTLEGKYSLWVYVHDRAANYSLLEVKDNLFIDTKSPTVSYEVLKDDDNYHITNEVTLNVSDLNEINVDSLKYGWFLKSKTNVSKSDLTSSFVNNSSISYPIGKYGEYKLYVSASDSLGNEMFVSLNKVFKIDTDIIRISLVGEEKITILKGQKYVDEGALAYKGEASSGGRVSEISVTGDVNNKKSGTYYITYTSGEGDLLVSVTRTIVVKDNFPYIIISLGVFVVGGIIVVCRLFIRRKENR